MSEKDYNNISQQVVNDAHLEMYYPYSGQSSGQDISGAPSKMSVQSIFPVQTQSETEISKDDYDTPESMLRSGAIMQAYGRMDMVSVNLAPEIHKVRWTIVKIGTKGKDHVDCWVKMDDMRRLCEEILSGTAAKRIAADKNNYPSAYQFVGGENGCRKLNVGSGQKGVRIQVQNNENGSWNSKIVAVSYSALQDMAFYFNMVTGLVPVERYYKSLVDAFWAGQESRKGWKRKAR